MKRPGGFDGGVEDDELQRRAAEARAAQARAAEAEAVEMRAAALSNAEGHAAPSSATPSSAAPSGAAEAETVDLSDLTLGELELSEVRSSRTGLARFAPRARDADPVRAAERRLRTAERQNKQRQQREKRRFTAGARRKRRRVYIALGTVAGLVLFVLVGTLTPVMAVREVRIEGAASVNVDEVQQALAPFDGVPLALVDEKEVLRALEGFPLIQRFAVERVPPSTLVVRIEERVPVIALAENDVFRLYDAAGVLVGEVAERPEGVPLGGDGLHSTSSKGFLMAAKVVRDMPGAMRAQLAEVSAVSGQDVTFMLTNGIEVFWGNDDETKRKSLVLEAMLASLADRPVSHIDVSSTESPIFR